MDAALGLRDVTERVSEEEEDVLPLAVLRCRRLHNREASADRRFRVILARGGPAEVTVDVSTFPMAPRLGALLPEKVLMVTIAVPCSLSMAPAQCKFCQAAL